jgi:acetyl-CoA carboxylase biotin carboxyl carrier protein
LDLRKLKKLIELVEESGISELEITEGEEKVRINRGATTNQPQINQATTHPEFHQPLPASVETPSADNKKKIEGTIINSPMVGTFYTSSKPGAEPFVKVGSKVKTGDILCIIEAMKLLNEIQSDYDGEIVEVLVENAEPVEFGQPLFRIN